MLPMPDAPQPGLSSQLVAHLAGVGNAGAPANPSVPVIAPGSRFMGVAPSLDITGPLACFQQSSLEQPVPGLKTLWDSGKGHGMVWSALLDEVLQILNSGQQVESGEAMYANEGNISDGGGGSGDYDGGSAIAAAAMPGFDGGQVSILPPEFVEVSVGTSVKPLETPGRSDGGDEIEIG